MVLQNEENSNERACNRMGSEKTVEANVQSKMYNKTHSYTFVHIP